MTRVITALQRHHQLIDSLIASALPTCSSFADLLPRLAGAGPWDAIDGLRRLAGPDANHSRAAALLREAASGGREPCGLDQGSTLPLPHPLDSEWRFSADDVEHLVERLLVATAPGDEILLVGTPSIAAALRTTKADRRIRFVGQPDLVTDSVRRLFADDPRLAVSGGGQAAAVIVDPPWYHGPFVQMLGRCAAGCRPGAPIFTVLPRAATRPGMAKDVEDMLASATTMGLHPDGQSPFEIAYRTPLFEACALDRAGMVPGTGLWRRGDCLVLTKRDGGELPEPADDSVDYIELMIDGARVRLVLGLGEGPVAPIAVEDAEVSSSISARSPTRRQANLWTTTNRALRVDEGLAQDAIEAIARREGLLLSPGLTHRRIDSARRTDVELEVNMIHYLLALFDREIADANRLAGEGSWSRGAKGMRCSSGFSDISRAKAPGTKISPPSLTARYTTSASI